MLRGMTGFVQEKGYFKESLLQAEVRSLNHRFFECSVHLPEGLGVAEDLVKDLVRAKVKRGKILVVLSIANARPKVLVNYGLADSYVRALKQLRHKLKLDNNLSLSQIVSMPGILSLEKNNVSTEMVGAIKDLVKRALEKLISVRSREGRVLYADVLRHTLRIKRETSKIRAFVKSFALKKQRMLPIEEYSAFLKSTDVAEEMTRINYHVRNFQATLGRSASCGKELDFISQEIQREANTISAKAQDARVSGSVVVIKSAIDKIREQLQNAE